MSSRLTVEGLCLDEYSANDAYAAVHFKAAPWVNFPKWSRPRRWPGLWPTASRPEQSLLDVGCGAGHYLRSYKRAVSTPFSYVGVDYYTIFLDKARQAWGRRADRRISPRQHFRIARCRS